MMRVTGLLTIGAALLLPVARLAAQDDSVVVAEGRKLAEQWCAECHVIDRDQDFAGSDAIPTFPEVAASPAVTSAGLKAFFSSPHQQMPDIQLTQQQIDEIVAYILSLREP